MTEVEFRRLRRSDLSVVAELLKSSFDENVRPYMTHCQHGIGEFLAVSVDAPESAPSKRAYVGVVDGAVVAYADFREVSSTDGFLSYICVDDRWRGRGIAPLLFSEFLREHPSIERLGLDVFANNSTARRLYVRLGFTPESTSAWVSRTVDASHDRPEGRFTQVRGFEAALASRRLYGFGSFEAAVGDRGFTIGVIGDSTAKVASAHDFNSEVLVSAISHLLPSVRKLFAILPVQMLADVDVEYSVVAESSRQSSMIGTDMRAMVAGKTS